MIKGVIFISNVTKAMEHEWFVDAVDRTELDLEFILFNSKKSELNRYIVAKGFRCRNYSLPNKYFVPFYVFYFTFKLFFKRPHFVHCHLFEASLIGIISSKIAGVKKRIHTRHHGDFHHVYFPGAVKYDLFINRLSTIIVAVSSNIRSILMEKENVPADKIEIIPHGIPVDLMNKQIAAKDIESIREKYDLLKHTPVIGVISRFVEWKGIQFIIPAFKNFRINFPNAKLVLANANGDYEQTLRALLADLPPSSYVLINFEPNVDPLFKTFDIFVHSPVDSFCEAFGQVYIEALNLEVPMICTLSGIACEMIRNNENALVVNYKDSDSIYNALMKMMGSEDLRAKLKKQGKEDVKEYSFEKKYNKLRLIYLG